MRTQETEAGYLISIEPGEEIVSMLGDFAQKNNILSATLTAIGAVASVELGYYELTERQYHWKTFEGTIEIVSALGNIAWLPDKPIVHLHGVFSGTDFVTFGGHVRRGVVSAACEVMLIVNGEPLVRSFDDATGLNLWDLRQ